MTLCHSGTACPPRVSPPIVGRPPWTHGWQGRVPTHDLRDFLTQLQTSRRLQRKQLVPCFPLAPTASFSALACLSFEGHTKSLAKSRLPRSCFLLVCSLTRHSFCKDRHCFRGASHYLLAHENEWQLNAPDHHPVNTQAHCECSSWPADGKEAQ